MLLYLKTHLINSLSMQMLRNAFCDRWTVFGYKIHSGMQCK